MTMANGPPTQGGTTGRCRQTIARIVPVRRTIPGVNPRALRSNRILSEQESSLHLLDMFDRASLTMLSSSHSRKSPALSCSCHRSHGGCHPSNLSHA